MATTPVDEVVALQAADVLDAERRGEVRVLTEGLVHATPAGLERDVQHRAERLGQAEAAHLAADEFAHLAAELGRPGRGDTGLGGEHDVAGRLGAGDRLVVEDRGNAETGVLDEVALDEVDLVGDPLRVGAAGGGQRGDLADAVAEDGLEGVGAEAARARGRTAAGCR